MTGHYSREALTVMAAGALGIAVALAAVAVALVATIVWAVPGTWRAALRAGWAALWRESRPRSRRCRVSVRVGAPSTAPLHLGGRPER